MESYEFIFIDANALSIITKSLDALDKLETEEILRTLQASGCEQKSTRLTSGILQIFNKHGIRLKDSLKIIDEISELNNSLGGIE